MDNIPILFLIGAIAGAFVMFIIQTMIYNAKVNRTLKEMDKDYAKAMKFIKTMPPRYERSSEYVDGKNRAIYDENGEMCWNTVQGIVGSGARITYE